MGQAKLLALTALALCAFGAASVAPAFGAELLETLPEFKRTGAGESIGATIYENLGGTLKLECTSATGTGEETSSKPPEGTFHTTFKGCKTTISGLTVKCTGLGDATAGEILTLGTARGVFDKNPLTETLTTAGLTVVEPTHFVCAGFALIVVEGTILCLALNPTVKSTTHEGHCNETKGDPEEVKYWTAAGEEQTAKLTQKVGTGAAEDVALLGLGKGTTAEEVFADQ